MGQHIDLRVTGQPPSSLNYCQRPPLSDSVCPTENDSCASEIPTFNPKTTAEQAMKHNIGIAILLMVAALVLTPETPIAEVRQHRGSNGLHARRTATTQYHHTRSEPSEIDPMSPLARFYQILGQSPVWVDAHGWRPQGEALLAAIGDPADAGLESDEYLIPDLMKAWSDSVAFSNAFQVNNLRQCIQFDRAITYGVLRYAEHLAQGRVMPESLFQNWPARRRAATRDIPVELAIALKENRLTAYFESLHPNGQAYRRLRIALEQYRQIRRSGGWPTIAPGPTLKIGDTGFRVAALTRRLHVTGDWSKDLPMDRCAYDESVETAVRWFQRRHGLQADGLVGQRTLTELNIPVEKRIAQLQLNMERWRWFQDSLGDRYLMVNIPAFELSIVEADTQIKHMRAIVGRKSRQTPILSGRMTYLEFNPYWNIPRNIARKDILPKAISDPTYLTRLGIRIFDSWDHQARELDPMLIPWDHLSARNFPYRLRQDPSDVNALGRVKFMFPNPLSIYIHDTPGKVLFRKQARSFSSGCIRVKAPLVLAQYLLSQQGWDHARLEAAVAQGQRQAVVLDNPIPVHLVYFTAWVDREGWVNFRQDIYGHDQRLLIALNDRHVDRLFCSND
jgi:murein L,D-transpeptidase YcbB/YkuD